MKNIQAQRHKKSRFEHQVIIYLDKGQAYPAAMRFRSNWLAQRPTKTCELVYVDDIVSEKIQMKKMGVTRLYIIGHSSAENRVIFHGDERPIYYTELARIVAFFIGESDVIVSLIICQAARTIDPNDLLLKSDASQFQIALSADAGRNITVLARTEITETIVTACTQKLTLLSGFSYEDVNEKLCYMRHQPYSKIVFSLNEEGTQIHSDSYTVIWKQKLLSKLESLSVLALNEEEKQVLCTWVRNFKDKLEYDIYNTIISEIRNRSPLSPATVNALVIHLIDFKLNHEITRKLMSDSYFSQKPHNYLEASRLIQTYYSPASHFISTALHSIDTVLSLNNPRLIIMILFSTPANRFIKTIGDFFKAVNIFTETETILFTCKLVSEFEYHDVENFIRDASDEKVLRFLSTAIHPLDEHTKLLFAERMAPLMVSKFNSNKVLIYLLTCVPRETRLHYINKFSQHGSQCDDFLALILSETAPIIAKYLASHANMINTDRLHMLRDIARIDNDTASRSLTLLAFLLWKQDHLYQAANAALLYRAFNFFMSSMQNSQEKQQKLFFIGSMISALLHSIESGTNQLDLHIDQLELFEVGMIMNSLDLSLSELSKNFTLNLIKSPPPIEIVIHSPTI